MNSRGKLLNYLTATPPSSVSPPRGEIWIAPQVLLSKGFPNNVQGVANFAAQMGANLCFFSCGGSQPVALTAAGLKETVTLTRSLNLACGAVVDGPWQRMTAVEGLMPLLQKIISDPSGLQKALNIQADLAWDELAAWTEAGVDLILLADDLAYSGGLYFSPSHFNQLLLPCYRDIFSRFQTANLPQMAFHSDGDLSPLIPDLIDTGFTLFSLEPESIDLEHIQRLYSSRIILMSGIRADWLYGESAADRPSTDFPGDLPVLLGQGKFILSSTCGLFHPSSVTAIESIYHWVDSYYEAGS